MNIRVHGQRHDTITHPNAQFDIFSAVHLHAFIQQTNLLKVQPVHHEAANQSWAPGRLKTTNIKYVFLLLR